VAGPGKSINKNNRNGNLKIIEVKLKKQGGYALQTLILVMQDPFKRPPVLYKDPYSTYHHIVHCGNKREAFVQ